MNECFTIWRKALKGEKGTPVISEDKNYISSEDSAMYDGMKYVTSRIFNSFFGITKSIPKPLLDILTEHNETAIEELIFGERPLMSETVSHPFWKDSKEYDFDTIEIQLFGSLGLISDRYVLDAIIAIGNQLNTKVNPVKLEDLVNYLDMDIKGQYSDTELEKTLLNRGTYYHIPVAKLFSHLRLKLQTKSRNLMKARIERLSKMLFVLKKFRGGVELPKSEKRNFIYPEEVYFILDHNKLKNKNNYTVDTYTDILVCVNEKYVDDLDSSMGFLSRQRLIDTYPKYNSVTGLSDFLRFIDQNKRTFIHTKKLSWLIDKYFESKNQKSMMGLNISHVKRQLTTRFIDETTNIEKDFNFTIRLLVEQNSKKVDYQLFYNGDAS